MLEKLYTDKGPNLSHSANNHVNSTSDQTQDNFYNYNDNYLQSMIWWLTQALREVSAPCPIACAGEHSGEGQLVSR